MLYLLKYLSVGKVEFYENHVLSHDIISTINIVENNSILDAVLNKKVLSNGFSQSVVINICG